MASGDDDRSLLLYSPLGGRPQTVRSDEAALRLPAIAAPGNYRLKSVDDASLLGFSVNLPIEAS
ncbi:MAG: hypothetical protein KDF65_01610, partial [Anaerolineae bacterium]|nr:hypothetical protein [Anaerolineae bacterium]